MTDTPPGPAPARPTWNLPSNRRELDLKIVVAVLIGLVSVTGAVMTWRSAQLGENATDLDRLAVAQTAQEQRTRALREMILDDARQAVGDAAEALRLSAVLEDQAATGQPDAAALTEEAFDQALVGEGILANHFSGLLQPHVTIGDDGTIAFDEAAFVEALSARALTAGNGRDAPVDPTSTIRTANDLRDESERFDLWRIPLAAAVVLLTLAQVLRSRPVRLGLAGLATLVWLGATVLAFGGV